MVPVEPVSLTIGAATLANLFSTCLDCFGTIDAGTNFSQDSEIALARPEAQKALFYVWGSTVGLNGNGSQFNEQILGPKVQLTIHRLLSCIVDLFHDTDKLRNRYGLKKAEQPDVILRPISHPPSERLDGYRFRLRLFQTQTSLEKKLRWAVYDKNKFTFLIMDLKDLLNQLSDVTQSVVNLEVQRRAFLAEVSSLSDARSLEILEEAMREEDLEASEIARQRVVQLTNGSILDTEADRLLSSGSANSIAYSQFPIESSSFSKANTDEAWEIESTAREDLEENSDSRDLDSLIQSPDFAYGQQNNLFVIQQRDQEEFESICNENNHLYTAAEIRVRRELKSIYREGEPLISVEPEDQGLRTLLASIQGPANTPHEGGVFFIRIQIPLDYPLSPPSPHFLTPILHPNIDHEGLVVIDILNTGWKPIWHLRILLLSILSLLDQPDWLNAISSEVAQAYGRDPYKFEAQARRLTQKYAQRTEPLETPYQELYLEIVKSLEIPHPLLQRSPEEQPQGITGSPGTRRRWWWLLFCMIVFAMILSVILLHAPFLKVRT